MELAPRHQRLGPRLRAAGIIGSGASFAVGEEFFQGLDDALRPNGFRPDIRVFARAHRRDGVPHTCIDASYNPEIGLPSHQDLQAAVEHALPGREVVLDLVALTDQNHGWLSVPVRRPEDRIPVGAADRIPEGFRHVVGGMYLRADAPGVRWQLERDAAGALALVRVEDEPNTMGDFERRAHALADRPVIGDDVQTPDGRGVLVARTAEGEPIVDLDGTRFRYLSAQVERVKLSDPGDPPAFKPGHYDPAKQRAYEKKFFTDAYGSAQFAEGLTQEYGRGASSAA